MAGECCPTGVQSVVGVQTKTKLPSNSRSSIVSGACWEWWVDYSGGSKQEWDMHAVFLRFLVLMNHSIQKFGQSPIKLFVGQWGIMIHKSANQLTETWISSTIYACTLLDMPIIILPCENNEIKPHGHLYQKQIIQNEAKSQTWTTNVPELASAQKCSPNDIYWLTKTWQYISHTN